jgi:hypothetical protein
MPLDKWVQLFACFLGGYFLRWWVGVEDKDISNASASSWALTSPVGVPPPREELKLALICNGSLAMGKGKIGRLLIVSLTYPFDDTYSNWLLGSNVKVVKPVVDITTHDGSCV